jgi:CO/xanthine dehydrogenase Mo-binding subunit
MAQQFVTDMVFPDMLHCITVRATTPRGRVLEVRHPELPREVRLFTAAEIPGENVSDIAGTAVPILAGEYVSYYGEPVALLVGPDLEDLAVLAEDTEVICDPFEPVYEPDADDPDHRAAERHVHIGDAAGELANAYQVVQGEYRTGVQEHMYNEPLAAVAAPENGHLAVYVATQWVHHAQRTCRRVLGGHHRLVVRVTALGEHLDGKLWEPSLVAAQAALAAHLTRKPVRLAYSAPEDFRYTTKRAPMFASYSAGLDVEGNLLALQVRLVFNLGAYPIFAQEIVDRAAVAAVGDYGCEHVGIHATGLQSNLPPLNAFAGLGSSQASFALESHVARIAELAQVPPDIWKGRNIRTRRGRGSTGKQGQRSTGAGLVEETSRRADFQRKHAAYELQKKRRTDFTSLQTGSRGIGLAFALQGSGFLGRGEQAYPSKVKVRLEEDGSVRLSCPAPGRESPLGRYWRARAASILDVNPDSVVLADYESSAVPDSGPAFLSRRVTIITDALENCCAAVAKKRFRQALPIEASRSYRLPRSLKWNPESFRGQPFTGRAAAAAVVEVEVDPMTLDTIVRAVWLGVDAGRLLDRAAAVQTAERGIFQALGWAASESISYHHGAVRPSDYERYGPDARAQNPRLSVEFYHFDGRENPRGIGELPFSCVPAAYAAAVSQATGNYIDRLPVTPALLESYLGEP